MSTPQLAKNFLKFVDACPSPLHAAATMAKELENKGFKKISESDDWRTIIKPNGLYYFTRNQTTICSFAIGGAYASGDGVNVVASHVDSCCPRVKPRSKVTSAGYLQLGVHLYGGGLWDTWFDRELGIAGRVITRTDDGSSLKSSLVHIDRPIVSIPNLCIHLGPRERKTNEQTHVLPILASELKGQLEAVPGAPEHHHPLLLDILSKELNVKPQSIVDFELSLFSTQPSAIGGALEEFIYAPRIDNLMGCYTSLHGYLRSLEPSLETEKRIRCFVAFDHEEVGSVSAEGAGSSLVVEALTRVVSTLSNNTDPNVVAKAFRKSFITSNDMAHALHPNYQSVHEKNHQPKIHGGLTIKTNVNQRYATNGVGSAMFKHIAANRDLPLQEFVVPNDSRCGSTIGPRLSATSGIRTIDVGMPQLSMHSVREMCGVDDVEHCTKFFQAFYEDFTELDETVDFN